MKSPADLIVELYSAVAPTKPASRLIELLQAGAPVNATHPAFGNTALSNACRCDNVKAVELLLQHGADPNQRFSYRSPVDGRVEADRTALHDVVSGDAAKSLMQAGADVTAEDAHSATPLMNAVFHGRVDVVALLLVSGALPRTRSANRTHEPGGVSALADEKLSSWRQVASDQSLDSRHREFAGQRVADYKRIVDLLRAMEHS